MIWVESQDTLNNMKNLEWARGDSLWKHRWPVFLVSQMVKNLPVMHKTQVRSLGWEDPLEKRMATHSSIFAWRIPWTEEPGRLQSMGLERVDMPE